MKKNSWFLLSLLSFGVFFSSGAGKYKKQGKFLFRPRIQELKCLESLDQKFLNKEYAIAKKNPEKKIIMGEKRQRKISIFEGTNEELKINGENLEFFNKQENIINYENSQHIFDKINRIFLHTNDFYEENFYSSLEKKIHDFLILLFKKRQEGQNLQEQCNTLTSQLLLDDNHFLHEIYEFFSPEDIQKDHFIKNYLGRLSFDIVQTSRNFLISFEGAILNLEN